MNDSPPTVENYKLLIRNLRTGGKYAAIVGMWAQQQEAACKRRKPRVKSVLNLNKM